jgi:hypothetical protein
MAKMLFALLLPDAGRAVTFDDVNHLLVEVLLRLQFAAGRDLANVAVVDAAGAFEHDERAEAALQVPGLDRDRLQVFDEEAGDNRDFLRRLPVLVRVDARQRVHI